MPAYLTLLAALAVGGIVAVLAWLLFASKSMGDPLGVEKSCIHCGSAVFNDWRLCPECGRLIAACDSLDTATPAGSRGGASDSKPA